MSNAFYTLGIVLAIVVLLLFMRSIFIRRARATYIPPRVVLVGGGWNDGGIGGIGGRGYSPGPTVPTPVATRNPEVTEQLPKYEAAPPGYDTLYKDDQPPPPPPEAGESSSRSNGDVVINMPEPVHHHQQSAPSPAFEAQMMPPPPPAQREGAWGRARGLAGRVMGR